MGGELVGFLDRITQALASLVRAAETVEQCSRIVAYSAAAGAALLLLTVVMLFCNLFLKDRQCCCRDKGDPGQ